MRCRKVFILVDSHVGDSSDYTSTRMLPPLPPHHVPLDGDSSFDLRPPTKRESLEQPPVQAEVKATTEAKRFPPESGMWNVGDVVLGLYEVKPLSDQVPFAEGGMGVVNRVYHREWDLELAVKSPKLHIFQKEGGKINYEKEAQTWIELGLHPNIVTCYLVRRISGIPRLFAEFVSDGSLRDWILDGRLYEGGPEAALLRILNIAIQFAWGLGHAHEQKLLHLDVKPGNVMMSGQTAKVTDFGLARTMHNRAADSDEDAKNASGPSTKPQNTDARSRSFPKAGIESISVASLTPGYCSPEQFLAYQLAPRQEFDKMPTMTLQSDIWSWAVSVLAMFHGRTPCKKGGQTARKVFELFLKAEPRENRPLMPPPLVDLLFHCFQEEPSKRPESMDMVADELVKIYKVVSGMDFPRERPVSAAWTPESINNRAASMLDLDKPDEAAKLLEQASALQPWWPEITYNQTLLAWRTAKLTDIEAIERLETLVKMRSQSSTAFYALGLVQRERGNPKSAFAALESAMTLGPQEEIRRALKSAEHAANQGVRCLERMQIPPGCEDDIFVDGERGTLLVRRDAQAFELRETDTGRLRNTFKVSTAEQLQRHPGRVALSEDLLWELVHTPGDEASHHGAAYVILKRVGSQQVSARFQKIGWQRYFRNPEPGAGDLLGGIVSLPDISWIGEIKDNRVELYDKSVQKKTVTLLGHEDRVTALCFSTDGRFALSGSSDRTVRIWELPSGRCLRTLPPVEGTVDAVFFGYNNQFALSLVAGGMFRLWDISLLCGHPKSYRAPLLLSHVASVEEIGRRQSRLNRHCDEIRLAVQNGDYRAAINEMAEARGLNGWELVRRTLESEGIWNRLARHAVRKAPESILNSHSLPGHHEAVSTLALSQDATLLASSGRDQTIRIWNMAERKCTVELEGHHDWVRSLEITTDNRFVVSGSWDMSVRVWNLNSGQCVRRFEEKVKALTKIALNPQGRLVAIANRTGSVILWDVLTDSVMGRVHAHSGSVNSIGFHRNGQYMVTGGDDTRFCLWRLGADEPLHTITAHKAPVTAALLAIDRARLFSADREGRVVVWNLRANKMEFELQAHLGEITNLALSADERFCFSCGKDGKIRVCGIEDRSVNRTIEGHPGPIHALALDFSGKQFVTGGEDAVIRVWDVFWDYSFPGKLPVSIKADAVLRTLLSRYSPSPDAKQPPQVDSAIVKNIIREMQYRGFGVISKAEIQRAIQSHLTDWQGDEF